MLPGLDLYCTDPAQRIITADWDLVNLSLYDLDDLDDLSAADLSVNYPDDLDIFVDDADDLNDICR